MTTPPWTTSNHDRIMHALPELAAGRLAPRRARKIESHLEDCRACRARFEAHRLFDRIVEPASHERNDHPDASVLALCAVRPEELLEADRAALRAHLDRCIACRNEVEILAEALAAARPGRAAPALAPAVPRSTLSRITAGTGLRLAAALGAAAIALVALYMALLAGSDAPRSARGGDAPATAETMETELSHLELDDSRIIEADHRLTVSHVKVKPGARITFRAGEVAAFGDGFEISSGGAIAVESGGSRGHRPRRADS